MATLFGKTSVALIAIAFASLSTQAPAAVGVIGSRSCGKWVEYRSTKDSLSEIAIRNWIAGFLSGIAIGTNKDVLMKIDPSSVVSQRFSEEGELI